MKEELLELLKKYAYKKGEFTLSSGKTSEYYVNCKPVTLTGRGLPLTSLLMLKEVDAGVVGGLTLGADPLVSGVSLVSALDGRMVNALIVRKEPKGHGTGAWIEGLLPPKDTKVTVLEDVVTTGGSSIKAVEKLRDAGYVVDRVVTLVDRQEGGEEAMKEAGCRLMCVGFESPTQDALEGVIKKTNKERQIEFMEDVRNADLLVNGCFIMGLPGDTPQTMQLTIDFAKELMPNTAQFYPHMLYPGTGSFKWADENGYVKLKNWADWLTPDGLHNQAL